MTDALDSLRDEPPRAVAAPFTALGHDRGRFYFSTASGGQVLTFRGSELDRYTTLAQLARPEWWDGHFGDGQGKLDTKLASADLIGRCYVAGIYDPERVRGRGAWLDDGRVVMHLGNRLLVDGVECRTHEIDSEWIYEAASALPVELADPLTTREASRLGKVCEACGWEEPVSMGRILAGWIVVAQVCGAMTWRPHLWVSGEPGTGKTWIMKHVIGPLIGAIALEVDGKTTEPGLRGALGQDARPVLFDEPETQNREDRARVQQVIDMARHASSEDGATVIKGRSGGEGVTTARIKSAFCFSSVNVGITQAADETRTLMLTMRVIGDPDERAAAFAELRRLVDSIVTPAFSGRLLARTLSLVPVIRANAETFSAAIAARTGSRRMGDTLGVLLAGAWSLGSDGLLSLEEASAALDRQAWVGGTVRRQSVAPEYQRAIAFLAQQRIRTGPGGSVELPLGEVIEAAAGRTPENDKSSITASDAARALGRIGVRVSGDGEAVYIANGADLIGRMFEPTQWGGAWRDTLLRAPGAARTTKPIRFPAGFVGHAVTLPVALLIGEEASEAAA